MKQLSIPQQSKLERIAKVIARRGVCSRRQAEAMINKGRVRVNGCLISTPAILVNTQDSITVDNIELPIKPGLRLWKYYKPVGIITTHNDPFGRTTLFDSLPNSLPRVVSIGRLDLMSEGLILLTNDGELAHLLAMPSANITRVYRVRIFGQLQTKQLALLAKGVTIGNINYRAIKIKVLSVKNSNSWLRVTLKEGKNREIRKIFAFLGYKVSRLIRESYGSISLTGLKQGEIKEIASEIVFDIQNSLKYISS